MTTLISIGVFMTNRESVQPKTGAELIESFFEQLKKNKEKYPCQKTINSIITLYEKDKLSKTNIINALEKVRKNENK